MSIARCWYQNSAPVLTVAARSTRTWRCVVRRRSTRVAAIRRAVTSHTTRATVSQRCHRSPANTPRSTHNLIGSCTNCRPIEDVCSAYKRSTRKRCFSNCSLSSYTRSTLYVDRSIFDHPHLRPSLMLWHWPWPDDAHIRTWPTVRAYRIWTSYVKAFDSYRLTYIHTYRYTDTDKQTNRCPRNFIPPSHSYRLCLQRMSGVV